MDEKEKRKLARGAIHNLLASAKHTKRHSNPYSIIQSAIDCGTFYDPGWFSEPLDEETIGNIVDMIQARINTWKV